MLEIEVDGFGAVKVDDNFLSYSAEKKKAVLGRIKQTLSRQPRSGEGQTTGQPDTSLSTGFLQGIDNAQAMGAKGIGAAGEYLGIDSVKDWGYNEAREQEAEAAEYNYQRPTGDVYTELEQGNIGNAFQSAAHAVAENAPMVVPGIIGGAGAAAAGAAGAPVAAGGLLAGTALGSGVLNLGDIKDTKEEYGLDGVSGQDMLMAGGLGAIDAVTGKIGGKVGTGIAKRYLAESGGEAAQEGLTLANADTQGADVEGRDYAVVMTEGAVAGAGTKGAIDATTKTAKSVPGVDRYDKVDDPEKVALAKRLRDTGVDLKDVDERTDGAARNGVKRVESDLREEIKSDAKALLKSTEDSALKERLKQITDAARLQEPSTSPQDVAFIKQHFGDTQEGQRLISNVQQKHHLQDFLRGNIRGPLTSRTMYLDPTEAQAPFYRGMAVAGNLAVPGVGIMINRAAGAVETVMNKRSLVKRFVDSAERSGIAAPNFSHLQSSRVALEAKRAEAQRITNAAKEAIDAEKLKQAQSKTTSDRLLQAEKLKQAKYKTLKEQLSLAEKAKKLQEGPKVSTPKPKRGPAYAEKKRHEQELTLEANEEMFRTNTVPTERHSQGYRVFYAYTGVKPGDALAALNKLAQNPKSRVSQDDVVAFATNIANLGPQQMMNYQRLALQAGAPVDPDWTPEVRDGILATTNKGKKGKKGESSDSLKAFKSNATTKASNAKFKQQTGQAARQYADNAIQESNAFTSEEKRALMDAVVKMDRGDVTHDERMSIMDQTIDESMNNEVTKALAFKVLSPLAQAGNTRKTENWSDADPAPRRERAKKKAEKKKTTAPLPVMGPEAEAAPESTEPTPEAPTPTEPAKASPEAPQARTEASDGKVVNPEDHPVVMPPEAAPPTTEDAISEPVKKAIDTASKAKSTKGTAWGMISKRIAEYVQGEKYLANLPDTQDRMVALVGEVRALVPDADPMVLGEMLSNPQNATGYLTQESLTQQVSKARNISLEDAAAQVDHLLMQMETSDLVKRTYQKLLSDGRPVADPDGGTLQSVRVQPKGYLSDYYTLTGLIATMEKLPDVSMPQPAFSPDNGFEAQGFPAIKDVKLVAKTAPAYAPLLNFLNDMRQMGMRVDQDMLSMIQSKAEAKHNAGTGANVARGLNDALFSKTDKTGTTAVAQLLYQMQGSPDGIMFQNWHAGRNGRSYSGNGTAHSQGGDLMKGILRAGHKAPLGADGLDFLLHDFGNILGRDKASIADRRKIIGDTIKDKSVIDLLEKVSNDPFPGSPKALKHRDLLYGEAEGPFQAISVANEMTRLLAHARSRFPEKAKELGDWGLLNDQEVRADLAESYETDYIVQLDANNNSFQIAGLLMGSRQLLQATGLLPDPEYAHLPPEERPVSDVYRAPALGAAQVVPELKAVLEQYGEAPDSKGGKFIRKLFKSAVSNTIYGAQYNSKRETIRGLLEDEGVNKGYVNLTPPSDSLKTENGETTLRLVDNKAQPVTFTIRKDGKGKKGFQAYKSVRQKNQWVERKVGSYDSVDQAAQDLYLTNLAARMEGEITKQIHETYPDVSKFMKFFDGVAKVMKDRGQGTIKVPSPDGMPLSYDLDHQKDYVTHDTQVGNRDIRIGMPVDNGKFAGKGLAAFVNHMHDAYIMREAHRRATEAGEITFYNPIHDSHGFLPGEAAAGQRHVMQVMQSLADPTYNVFQRILEANGITPEELEAARTQKEIKAGEPRMPERHEVEMPDYRQTPTAVA